jgi:protein-S-isoprenylcysteine O-methyltransferase Ste14
MAREIRSWIVPLKAHEFDAEDLHVYLAGYPITVNQRGSKFFLVIPVELTGPGYESVIPLAQEQVARINGAASVVLDGYRYIGVDDGAYYGIDAEGEIAHTVVAVGTTEGRAKAGHITVSIDGVQQPDSGTGQLARLLQVAETSTGMADALAVVGRLSPIWSELYLVYELVESNTGSRMYSDGWITQDEGTLFTRTANSYTALGREARHGKDRRDPPSNPMPRPLATQLMRKLVAAWINSALSRQPFDDPEFLFRGKFIFPLAMLWLIGGFVISLLVPLVSGVLFIIGLCFYIGGLTVVGFTFYSFAHHRGLVTTGIHRYSRNPGYVGWVLVLLGLTLMGWSRSIWSIVFLIYLIVTIFYFHWTVLLEERFLANKYRDSYREYLRNTSRYFGVSKRG